MFDDKAETQKCKVDFTFWVLVAGQTALRRVLTAKKTDLRHQKRLQANRYEREQLLI